MPCIRKSQIFFQTFFGKRAIKDLNIFLNFLENFILSFNTKQKLEDNYSYFFRTLSSSFPSAKLAKPIGTKWPHRPNESTSPCKPKLSVWTWPSASTYLKGPNRPNVLRDAIGPNGQNGQIDCRKRPIKPKMSQKGPKREQRTIIAIKDHVDQFKKD